MNERLDGFRRGARAMFDSLLMRAANHYHGNPKVQEQCDYDNALVVDWAKAALAEVAPKDCEDWENIVSLKERLKTAESALVLANANSKDHADEPWRVMVASALANIRGAK